MKKKVADFHVFGLFIAINMIGTKKKIHPSRAIADVTTNLYHAYSHPLKKLESRLFGSKNLIDQLDAAPIFTFDMIETFTLAINLRRIEIQNLRRKNRVSRGVPMLASFFTTQQS
jgi:hypothetical protein